MPKERGTSRQVIASLFALVSLAVALWWGVGDAFVSAFWQAESTALDVASEGSLLTRNEYQSAGTIFSATPTPAEVTYFVHVSDAHMGTSADYEGTKDKNVWERKFKRNILKSNEIIRPPIVVDTGDTVTVVDNYSYAVSDNAISHATVPYLKVPGNHDYPVSLWLGYGWPRYFSYDLGDVQVIGFDSLHTVDTQYVNIKWLENELRQNAPNKKIILASHYPLVQPDWAAEWWGTSRLHPDPTARLQILDLMRKYNVLAHLNGHIHIEWQCDDPLRSEALHIDSAPAGELGYFRVLTVQGDIVGSTLGTEETSWPFVVIASPQRYYTPTLSTGDTDTRAIEGLQPVRAVVFSPATITSVSYQVDSTGWQAMTQNANGLWEAWWDASSVSPGPHTLYVHAADSAGGSTITSIPIKTTPPDDEPSATITSPIPGPVSGVVNVTGVASDAEGLSKVRIYVDGALASSDLGVGGTSAGFSWNWNTGSERNGRHVLLARVYDTWGHAVWSDPVEVVVSGGLPENPPTVTMDTPSQGATVSGEVNLTATATDDRGIRWMNFYVRPAGGTWTMIQRVDCSDVNNFNQPFPTSTQRTVTWNTWLYPNGTYEVKAEAYDTATYSQVAQATRTVTVSNAAMPSVSITRQVNAPWNDHWQLNGVTDSYTLAVQIGMHPAGFRFRDITIPRGAIITSASLVVQNKDYTAGEMTVRIYAEDVDRGVDFQLLTLSERPRTSAYVTWHLPADQIIFGTSPDLAAVIQQIVNRPGWQSGNAINLLLIPEPGSTARNVCSYEGSPSNAARLNITYTLQPLPTPTATRTPTPTRTPGPSPTPTQTRTPGPVATAYLPIVVGWNLLSLPIEPDSSALEDLLAPIAGAYDLVYAYEGCDQADPWKKYDTNVPPFLNDLQDIHETEGFWLHGTSTTTLPVSGHRVSEVTIPLCAGWNLVGYPLGTSQPVTYALRTIDGWYDLVYAYDASDTADPWKKYDVNVPPFLNDLTELRPGWGYWIHVTSDCTLILAE
ncbi:MAG: metallophosphoesterase [Chloroflexi bacterium]|nr:metallophosphoesterase [Chloroflexota bacterium]